MPYQIVQCCCADCVNAAPDGKHYIYCERLRRWFDDWEECPIPDEYYPDTPLPPLDFRSDLEKMMDDIEFEDEYGCTREEYEKQKRELEYENEEDEEDRYY